MNKPNKFMYCMLVKSELSEIFIKIMTCKR